MLWGSFGSVFSEGIPWCNAAQHVTQHHRELAHNAAVKVGMSSQSAPQGAGSSVRELMELLSKLAWHRDCMSLPMFFSELPIKPDWSGRP